jgi:hypothetical protein
MRLQSLFASPSSLASPPGRWRGRALAFRALASGSARGMQRCAQSPSRGARRQRRQQRQRRKRGRRRREAKRGRLGGHWHPLQRGEGGRRTWLPVKGFVVLCHSGFAAGLENEQEQGWREVWRAKATQQRSHGGSRDSRRRSGERGEESVPLTRRVPARA